MISCTATAQSLSHDSTYYNSFTRDNVIEIFPGTDRLAFTYQHNNKTHDKYTLLANTSDYLGVFLHYKWVTVKYLWSLPRTSLDNSYKPKYQSLRFRFPIDQWVIRPYYDSYTGLLISEPLTHHKRKYTPFRDISYRQAGTDIYYYTNKKHFSYRAGNFFSQEQKKSAGAVFVNITPQWEQTKWITDKPLQSDSLNYTYFKNGPQFVSLLNKAGYQYNIMLPGSWLVSPMVSAGAGFIKHLQPHTNIKWMTYYQGQVNAGMNGPRYYAYASIAAEATRKGLDNRTITQTNEEVDITFGLRFANREKKILGVL